MFNSIIWIPRCNKVKEWETNRKREISEDNYIDNDDIVRSHIYNHHTVRINGRDVPQDRYNRSSLDRKSKIEWSALKVMKNIKALIKGNRLESWVWLKKQNYIKI
jgi:hypothetical protein